MLLKIFFLPCVTTALRFAFCALFLSYKSIFSTNFKCLGVSEDCGLYSFLLTQQVGVRTELGRLYRNYLCDFFKQYLTSSRTLDVVLWTEGKLFQSLDGLLQRATSTY